MRSLLVICLIVGLTTSSRPAHAQANPQIKKAAEPGRHEPDMIRFADLEAVALRVSSICAEPPRIVLHVGDTLALSSAVVVAYDSLGAVLGSLTGYDSALLKRTHLVPTTDNTRRYVAIAAGEAEFTLSFPHRKWTGRKDAPVSTRLVVQILPD